MRLFIWTVLLRWKREQLKSVDLLTPMSYLCKELIASSHKREDDKRRIYYNLPSDTHINNLKNITQVSILLIHHNPKIKHSSVLNVISVHFKLIVSPMQIEDSEETNIIEKSCFFSFHKWTYWHELWKLLWFRRICLQPLCLDTTTGTWQVRKMLDPVKLWREFSQL